MKQIRNILGTLFASLGGIVLCLAVIQYLSISPETLNIKTLAGVAAGGFIFFVSGLGMVSRTHDDT